MKVGLESKAVRHRPGPNKLVCCFFFSIWLYFPYKTPFSSPKKCYMVFPYNTQNCYLIGPLQARRATYFFFIFVHLESIPGLHSVLWKREIFLNLLIENESTFEFIHSKDFFSSCQSRCCAHW